MSPKTNNQPVDRKSEITSNMEDYLKAIHELLAESGNPEVRVTDIANRIGVTRPSVVGMIKHLTEHSLVAHDHYGGVALTDHGKDVAREMAERHGVLRRFLEEVLGLSAELAEEDACRMEHTLSPETIDRFLALEEFREQDPEAEPMMGEPFKQFISDREVGGDDSG